MKTTTEILTAAITESEECERMTGAKASLLDLTRHAIEAAFPHADPDQLDELIGAIDTLTTDEPSEEQLDMLEAAAGPLMDEDGGESRPQAEEICGLMDSEMDALLDEARAEAGQQLAEFGDLLTDPVTGSAEALAIERKHAAALAFIWGLGLQVEDVSAYALILGLAEQDEGDLTDIDAAIAEADDVSSQTREAAEHLAIALDLTA